MGAISHTLTGVWVEILIFCFNCSFSRSHTLTGVWVEILMRLDSWKRNIASHPHGCVSWNKSLISAGRFSKSHPHGCVSWNILRRTDRKRLWVVTPSRVCELKFTRRCAILQTRTASHPHGCVSWNFLHMGANFGEVVTPSRVCELKSSCVMLFSFLSRHTLTGVWVEIIATMYSYFSPSHTLTGVWVEIPNPDGTDVFRLVTPSRVCELKWISYNYVSALGSHTLTGVWVEIFTVYYITVSYESHPHGCVSWNYILPRKRLLPSRHTLTGVWVEMPPKTAWDVWQTRHTLTGVWVEII